MNKKNVPEVRFAGFSGDWERRKFLDNIKSIIDFRGRTPKKLGMNWSDSGYLALSALNVKDGYIDLSSDAHFGNETLYQEWMAGSELHKGQVLFTTEAPMGNVAQVPDNSKYILSQRTIAFEVDDNILTESFLYILLKSPNVFRDLTAMASGGTAKGVSQKSLVQLYSKTPKSILEQTAIGNFFKNLDELITLHQRKNDKLVIVKKAMLDKMFPMDGESVPEVRFAGFSGDWERKKLGELGETYTGLSGKTKVDFGHGDGKYITYMNVFSNPVTNPSMTEPIEIDPKQNSVKTGDVFFTTSSETPDEVGMSSVWLEQGDNIYLNSFCFGYRPVEKFDSYYLAYMLRCNSVREKIAFLAQGISRYNISKNRVMEITVPTPDSAEQTAIGNFFKNLDSLITGHQQKLEKLKTIKKSMLDKMFV